MDLFKWLRWLLNGTFFHLFKIFLPLHSYSHYWYRPNNNLQKRKFLTLSSPTGFQQIVLQRHQFLIDDQSGSGASVWQIMYYGIQMMIMNVDFNLIHVLKGQGWLCTEIPWTPVEYLPPENHHENQGDTDIDTWLAVVRIGSPKSKTETKLKQYSDISGLPKHPFFFGTHRYIITWEAYVQNFLWLWF